MQRIIHSRRGMSLVGVVVGSVIAAIGFLYFLKSSSSMRRQAKSLNERVVAEAYATELLEFFRSFEDVQLDAYLSENPYRSVSSCPGDAACEPYDLCSHINILDRASGNLINQDDLAALPDSPQTNPLYRQDAKLKPNRWYQVQVVDLAKTVSAGTGNCPAGGDDCGKIEVNTTHCSVGTDEVYFQGQAVQGTLLNENETFLITVGVSWFPRNIPDADINVDQDVKRVVLTTIIPSQRT